VARKKRPSREDIVRLATAQMPGFLAAHDVDGTLLWSNRVAYGLDESVYGRPSHETIAEEDRPRWLESFRRCLYHREVVEYELRIVVPAAPGWVQLRGRLAPVVSGDRVVAVVSVAHDSTFRGNPHGPSPMARFLLCPLSRRVVRELLAAPLPLKAVALASRVGERSETGHCSTRLGNMLRGLCDRNILQHVSGGYAVSAAFRPYAEAALEG
jgi:hypothetical protein